MITHDEMCASVASAIRHGLDRNGMTVSELPEITMLNRRTLWRMMNGHGLPNLYNAYLIRDVLGMSLDEMIRHKSHPEFTEKEGQK